MSKRIGAAQLLGLKSKRVEGEKCPSDTPGITEEMEKINELPHKNRYIERPKSHEIGAKGKRQCVVVRKTYHIAEA